MSSRLPASALLACALAPAAAEAQAPPIVVADPPSGEFSEHPATIRFRDTTFSELRWRGWGSSVAVTRGTDRVLVCRPSCAEGTVTRVGTTAWFGTAKGSAPPARLRVRGYRCDFSGTGERLTLRCKRGRRVATARWGG